MSRLFATVLVIITATYVFSVDAEITFIHYSDPHYNTDYANYAERRAQYRGAIDAINALPGTAYPSAVGGVTGEIFGAFGTGDLTESKESDWLDFVEDWGLDGTDGRLNVPSYEGAGNHDGPPSTNPNAHVRRGIIGRNPHRPLVTDISDNGLHYALDYGGAYFVQLNEFAGEDDDIRYPGNPAYNRKGQSFGVPPEKSLQFLRRTLADNVGDSGKPVLLFQHYSVDGWALNAWGGDHAWWTEEHALRLWEATEEYNLIAVMVGHDHSQSIIDWNGIPFYHMVILNGFGVHRIKDGQHTRVIRDWQGNRWTGTHSTSTSLNAGMPEELTGGPYLVYHDDPTRMTVMWHTSESIPVRLRWGTQEFRYELGDVQVNPLDAENNIYSHTITGLQPDNDYVYRVSIGSKSAVGRFYTAPQPTADKVKFLVYGDTAAGADKHDRIAKAMYARIHKDPAYHSLLIHTGGWVDDITQVGQWREKMFSRESPLRHARYLQARAPLMGPVGAHQDNMELFQNLLPYDFDDKGYYSFQYGPVHISVMDAYSDYTQGSAQYEWLVTDLNEANSAWKMVVFNGPRPWGSDHPEAVATRSVLQPVFEAQGVRLCIDGNSQGFGRTTTGGVEYIGLGSNEDPSLYYGAVTVEGTQMTFRVYDDGNVEVDSHVIAMGIPAVPETITYPENSSTGRYTISWTSSANADEYQLQTSHDGGNAWIDMFIGNDLVFAATVDDGEHRYRVRGINDEGPGDWRTGGHDCLVAMTSVEKWRRQYFDDPWDEDTAGPMADPNGDNIVNLVKFALRGDPHHDDSAVISPRMQRDPSTGGLYFTFRVRTIEGTINEETGFYTVEGLFYQVLTSNVPGAEWTHKDLTDANTELVENADGPYLRVHIGNELATGTKGFARLIVVPLDP